MILWSFEDSPHEFTTKIVSLLNFGAIFIASAKACAGSREGLTNPSSLDTSLNASRASSSDADVYLALPASF